MSVEYWMLADAPSGEGARDGSHSTPVGVAKAKKLHESLWPGRYRNFRMLVKDGENERTIEIPNIPVKINEGAAARCRMMLRRHTRNLLDLRTANR